MRTLAFIIAASALLAGCATIEEAYYVDREFGKANQAAWDQQVAYPDHRWAAQIPEGAEGITAEEIMDIHNETFAEKPEESRVFRLGVVD